MLLRAFPVFRRIPDKVLDDAVECLAANSAIRYPNCETHKVRLNFFVRQFSRVMKARLILVNDDVELDAIDTEPVRRA